MGQALLRRLPPFRPARPRGPFSPPPPRARTRPPLPRRRPPRGSRTPATGVHGRPTTPSGRDAALLPQTASILSPPHFPFFSTHERSSNRGGAPPCAIGGAAELAIPAAHIRLKPPPAPPRRALPCALTLGRPRQGIGLDSIAVPWLQLCRALGLRESLPSRPSFSPVASVFWSPHCREPSAPLRSRSLGWRRPNTGEQRHRAPPCAIPATRDLLRRRKVAQRVHLAETKP